MTFQCIISRWKAPPMTMTEFSFVWMGKTYCMSWYQRSLPRSLFPTQALSARYAMLLFLWAFESATCGDTTKIVSFNTL